MSLRIKVLIIIIAAMTFMVASLYVTARVILMNGLAGIERRDAEKYVERAFSALSRELYELERTTVDWSAWDDTYEFIDSAYPGYVQSNLVDDSFTSLRLNLIMYIHTSGEVVYGKAFDLDEEVEQPVPPEFLPGGSVFSHIRQSDVISGVVSVNEMPMFIVAQPILTSEGLGPARGKLVFGRYIGDEVQSRISQMTVSTIVLIPISAAKSDVNLSSEFLNDVNSQSLVVTDANSVFSYRKIPDIFGNTALVLCTGVPREIYQLGQDAVVFNILALIGIGLLLSGGVLWLMHKQVIVRIANLIKGINRITSTGDTSIRLETGGGDEISVVAGTVNGMLGALQESSAEIEKLYKEEKDLRLSLEEEIAKRAEYTRALVHELKTPITPLLAASELLLEELEDPQLKGLASNISRSSNNLNKRVDELLDLARGEVGQLKLNIAPLDSLKMLMDVAADIESVTRLKRQKLHVELPKALPVIWADEERVKQVVMNLLNNAIKYTPQDGEITLRASSDNVNLVVEVEDTGAGISEEDQKRLFDPYYRTENDRERLSGLGLGLAIAKSFVTLHGGKIWAKSVKGKGSIFAFSIPVDGQKMSA